MLSLRSAAVAAVVLCLVSALLVSAHSDRPFHPSYPPRASRDDGAGCSLCQTLMGAADVAVGNSTDLAAILSAMETECATLGGLNTLVCDGLAAALVKELPKVPEKLFSAGFYTPQILCSFLGSCSVPCCVDNVPTQVHLSAGGEVGAAPGQSMTVTWMTADNTAGNTVRYGLPGQTSLSQSVQAATSTYTQGGWIGAIHTAVFTNLVPNGAPVYYQVGGDASGWSAVMSFTPVGPSLPANYTFIQVGDMGAERNYSAGNQDYINYAASGKAPAEIAIDTVLHVGDISYADGYMERWDELFNAMQPTASQMPYMTCPGNHEIYFNFSSYKSRLHMPSVASNATLEGAMYYSYDAGCIHFVSLSSESPSDSPLIQADQVAWLAADLEAFEARRVAGRLSRKDGDDDECTYAAPTFAVVFIHRPLYCSAAGKEGTERCGTQAAYLRSQIEGLLVQYKVDLVFSGHVHAYERTSGVVNNVADASGPVYILNGAGGNREGAMSNWESAPLPWSLVRQGEFGLGTLQVLNATTINWQWFQQTDLANAVEIGGVPKATDQVYIYAKSQ